MKLSEAILKGCEGTEKVSGRFFKFDKNNKVVGCCVLGAAALVLGSKSEFDCWRVLREKFSKILCDSDLTNEIVNRNNDTDEPRESIAEWLASQGY